ncbi:hypothetical protein [Sporosarcina koreensis]|uniref:Uncharacterized protein n=1 Tax=Sporosarcina koreensis TaxID=334735 RepID=A0ABW0TTQ4_9BACL
MIDICREMNDNSSELIDKRREMNDILREMTDKFKVAALGQLKGNASSPSTKHTLYHGHFNERRNRGT